MQKIASVALLSGDHAYLNPADDCFFIRTYECPLAHDRDMILAFKNAEPKAVLWVASLLEKQLPDDWRTEFTFVPIPSSNGLVPKHAVVALQSAGALDVRGIIQQEFPTRSSHNGWRLPPQGHRYSLNEGLLFPDPKTVVLFDDVLTTGSHFRAAKETIQDRWDVRVVGLFLCRTCSLFQRCTASPGTGDTTYPSWPDPRCHLTMFA